MGRSSGGPGGGGDPGNSGGGSGNSGSGGGGRGGRGGSGGRPGQGSNNSGNNSGGSAPGGMNPGGGLNGNSGSGGRPGQGDGGAGSNAGGGGSQGGGNGSSNNDGSQTPGSPKSEGRRSPHAPGTTPSSRARNAMDRHAREAADRDAPGLISRAMDTFKSMIGLGEEEGVTTAKRLGQLKSLNPTLTDKELAGMVLGDTEASLEGAINAEAETSVLGQIASTASTVLGGLPGMAVGIGMTAAERAHNSSTTIGDVNAKSGMTMDDGFGTSMGTQAVGAVADGVVGHIGKGLLGPIGAKAGKLGAAVTGNVASRVGEAAADAAMRGERAPSTSIDSRAPGIASSGGGSSRASRARDAMGRNVSKAAPSSGPTASGFEVAEIDINRYSNGLVG